MNPRAALASLSLLLAACGGGTSSIRGGDGGGGGGDGGGPGSDGGAAEAGVSAAQAAMGAAMAYCTRAQACAPAYVAYDIGDLSTCEARFAMQLQTDLGATGTSETPAQLEACAQAFPQASCTDLLEHNLPMPCRPLPGMLANGVACESDGQCTGTRCSVPANAICGTCTSPTAAGGACGSDSDCEPKLACTNGACTPYATTGTSCSATQPCEPGLGCVAGTCGTPSPAGTTCADSTECDQLNGGFCNPVSKKCQVVAFAQPGSMCGLPGNNLTLCAGPGGFCQGDGTAPYVGTCIAHAADGSSCSAAADAGPRCDFEAQCVNGSCQVATSTSCH